MKQCQSQPRADPPPHPKRHHLYLLTPCYIHHPHHFTTTKKPLWLELHRLLPHLLVPTHLRHHEIHRRVLWYNMPLNTHLLRHCMQKHNVPRRVPPEPFQHHCLHVRHPMKVLLLHLLCFSSSNNAPNLFQDLLLHALVLHDVRHDSQ
ncbi:hypothetical protein QJS04_geneDACA013156 [Acorus gramineus]|uniref:Uncharacterized protein n=1 Tax=Acorus gramineus TaxID=55184 RepID=A0AAV9B8A5_ACOGR|nr:hypothetical protein QJS04_geneDACA013156 [Acorus gramineus]